MPSRASCRRPATRRQVEKTKIALRSAATGDGQAVLAPLSVRLLRDVVGSSPCRDG
jgi:hypothetical protein